MAANWNGDHVCAHPRVAPNGTEYCGCPHAPTLREIADIEREPAAEFTPPDPLADMRENVVEHLPMPYRRMVVAWIELAFAKGQCNASESMLRKLRGGGDRV